MSYKIKFKLNGKEIETAVKGNTLLLDLLREQLHVTGVKYACGIGECGACTVLIDGKPALSCLTLAVEVDGKEVKTVEGVDNIFSQKLVDEAGVQCGYCTPGFVMLFEYLPKYNPNLNMSEEDLKKYFSGNVCRCTGYVNIIKAAKLSLEELKNKSKPND
jgi:carbon-monoxide dehydrogenase small subunit